MTSKKLFLASTVLFVLVSLPFIGSVGASSVMWNQTYGGKYEDYAYSLVETSDGRYALAGEIQSSDSVFTDFWLVKTDEYGVIPEFPSWTILSIFLVTSLIIVLARKKIGG